MPETLIGIVPGSDDGSISIGVVNLRREAVASETFLLEKSAFDAVMAMKADSPLPDLVGLRDFLKSQIGDPKGARVLMELTPQVFDSDTVYFKLLTLLTLGGYCFFALGISRDKQKLIIHPAMPRQKPPGIQSAAEFADMTARQVLFLPPRLAQAYGYWLAGAYSSSEQTAVAASLIGRNMTLYHYLVLCRDVPSSGDFGAFFTMSEELRKSSIPMASFYLPQSVMFQSLTGQTEMLTWTGGEATKADEIEKIPLEYAVAAKRHENLGAKNAEKLAALTVCKLWGLTYTYSFRQEENPLGAAAQPRAPLYAPKQAPEAWLVESLKQEKPTRVSSVPLEMPRAPFGPPAKPITLPFSASSAQPGRAAEPAKNLFSRLIDAVKPKKR